MIRCPFYDNLRLKLYDTIRETYTLDFNRLSDNEKFVFLMSVGDYDSILPLIRYVNDAFGKRILDV